MALSDRIVGGLMLLVASGVFFYYTIWAFIMPFVPSDSSIHTFFPPREWAVRLPAFILVVGLGGIGAFVSKVVISEEQKRREKAARVKQG